MCLRPCDAFHYVTDNINTFRGSEVVLVRLACLPPGKTTMQTLPRPSLFSVSSRVQTLYTAPGAVERCIYASGTTKFPPPGRGGREWFIGADSEVGGGGGWARAWLQTKYTCAAMGALWIWCGEWPRT